MVYDKLISIAAALLIGGAALHAAPDNDHRKNERHSERSDRSSQHDKMIRKSDVKRQDVRQSDRSYQHDKMIRKSEPQRYTPHPVKPSPKPDKRVERRIEHRIVTPPSRSRDVVRKAPPARYVPPKTVVRLDKHRHYHRPPGARVPTYYQRPGYRIRTLPRLAVTLTLGGLLFYYADGLYYRHHDSGFVVSVPPVGLVVTTLPAGYTAFVYSGRTYYYYADVYYVWDYARSGYRVVNSPIGYRTVYTPGQVVDALPDGAYSVTINGTQYYRYADVYFMQAVQGDRVVYIVVTP